MSASRRTVALVATTLTAAALGAVTIGVAATSSAAPATTTTATTVTAGNPKVPDGRPCCGTTFLRPGQSLRSDNPGASSMLSGGLGAGPEHLLSTYSRYRLEVQDDGNLVEYDGTGAGRRAVWATGTRSATPTTLTFQTDGNVVLRDTAGKALWSTGTAGRAAAYFDVYGNGQVVTQDSTGHVLASFGPAQVAFPGVEVSGAMSPAFVYSRPYRELAVQSDGNVVEYAHSGRTRGAVWATNTAGAGEVRLSAQSDGNLVVRQVSTGRAVWASGSHGPTGYYQLDVQDDGNLVLYRTDGIRRVQAVWSTGIRR